MEASLLLAVLLWGLYWKIKAKNAENRRRREKRLQNRKKLRKEAFLAEKSRR